ncbi:unnamed protein product [Rotaria sp. Silwood2]|nr:unnamed protein product [Rotaria sp. Silwood2]CAF3135224.1 unnamed protein product [Rotaria sp. Silwood2]CAF3289325.1 unnamed protein product [Rotaria sp. Silwood2]CAF3901088.1 unnamed protein product [Rotaria sp. Silwood2]CAF3920192.1 unnamed protein product [Rotaria sp. Silwood2]
MPKSSETTVKECHDCGQSGPEWCSINHGVLLCDECCSVHLSLGRHISQIKSFKRSYWPPSQLNLIHELSSNGANLVWEYGLLDPQNKVPRKKPSAKDALPIKADFIRTKYQQMAYINRLKDETNGTFEDLHLQLHSIVRTDNVVTCLRFLSQGADPNFKNPETGTSSVHVAASRGQQNQIELLCIFGGDPAAVDNSGMSPEEHARVNGYFDLADRLVELQYELTDRLTCFISGKRPDHKTGQHIILPELNENLDISDPALLARKKLQQLPDQLFEDLAMDVFDEVERRELNTTWHAQVDKALIPLHVVPFLPVNPAFSATRNQGRQKLARYGPKEFATFIYDILNEVRRRYYGIIPQSPVSPISTSKFHTLPRQNNQINMSNTNASVSTQDILNVNGPSSISSTAALINAFIDSDDEPLYDKVASDEDYSSLPNNEQQKRSKIHKKAKKPSTFDSSKEYLDGILQSPTESLNLSEISNEEATRNQRSYDLKSRVANTELQLKYLACAHIDLKNELAVLHQMIQRLLDENLLTKVDQQVSNDMTTNQSNTSSSQIQTNTSNLVNNDDINRIINKSAQQLFDNHSRKSSPIVESDYDNTTVIEDPENPSSNSIRQIAYGHDKRSSRSMQRFPQVEENSTNVLNNSRSFRSTDYINTNVEVSITKSSANQTSQIQTSIIPISNGRARSCSGGRNKAMSPPILSRKGSCGQAESNGDIDKRTRKITHRIAELFSLIKENQSDRYVTCAERINNSVQDMIRLFDRISLNDEMRTNLDMLNTGAQQLLAHAALKEKTSTTSNTNRTEQIQYIIDDCYNIALATKSLVGLYQKL